ncbi:MAG: ribbon-helix-helix domain-containing protein [Bacteroidales bacterium]|jgi:MoaA/NifB/PqqE/SkfB family radical SAM enzyme|nr:ribbon-helix-helix domain-containing protein [Bacteroidales bacterium]
MKGKGKKLQQPNLKNAPDADLLRVNKATIMFNNKEMKAMDEYCKKYGIRNRSKFIREIVISTILEKFETDYPTLF